MHCKTTEICWEKVEEKETIKKIIPKNRLNLKNTFAPSGQQTQRETYI